MAKGNGQIYLQDLVALIFYSGKCDPALVSLNGEKPSMPKGMRAKLHIGLEPRSWTYDNDALEDCAWKDIRIGKMRPLHHPDSVESPDICEGVIGVYNRNSAIDLAQLVEDTQTVSRIKY